MKQLSNGRIIVSNQYHWDIPDTLFYPFTPPILLLAPLSFMTFSIFDPNNGSILSQTSYESPSYTNTNVIGGSVPEVKSIAELPNGKLSVLVTLHLISQKNPILSFKILPAIMNSSAAKMLLTAFISTISLFVRMKPTLYPIVR